MSIHLFCFGGSFKLTNLMRILNKIRNEWIKRNARSYLNYLRGKGVKIGSDCVFFCLRSIYIDLTRPSLIEIGNEVQFNRNFNLYTHDFVTAVFLNIYKDFVPSSGRVKIGNNVAFGINCAVLKGVTIGDNCFIAAGSVVTKDIPSNTVAGGIPAKEISSIRDYYGKRKTECINEAKEYALSIKERFGRRPRIDDFKEEFPLFWDHRKETNRFYLDLIRFQLGSHFDDFIENNKPSYNSFEDFLKDCGM